MRHRSLVYEQQDSALHGVPLTMTWCICRSPNHIASGLAQLPFLLRHWGGMVGSSRLPGCGSIGV